MPRTEPRYIIDDDVEMDDDVPPTSTKISAALDSDQSDADDEEDWP